jgi:hypothetical protein
MVLPSTTPTAPKKCSQEETMVDNLSQDILEKVGGVQPIKHRKKSTHSMPVSLEAHQPPSSFNHVSATFCIITLCLCTLPALIQSCSVALDAEISVSWH